MSKLKISALTTLFIIGTILILPSLFSDVCTQVPIISSGCKQFPVSSLQTFGSTIIGFVLFERVKKAFEKCKRFTTKLTSNVLIVVGVIFIAGPVLVECYWGGNSFVKWFVSLICGLLVGLWFSLLDLRVTNNNP